jgi:hypothetical protein
MKKINNAKTPADKERLMTEMQARIKRAEDEADKERKK